MQESVERTLEVTLAEYATLAAEIRGRSEAQASLMNIAAVASVGLTGYALQAGQVGRQLILLLPFVGGIFGLLWLDHHRAIGKLGTFIRWHSRAEILKAIQLLDDVPPELANKLLRWEWTSRHLVSTHRRHHLTSYVTPQALLFALPGLVGVGFGAYLLVDGWRDQQDVGTMVWQSLLLCLGVLLLLYLLLQWRDAFRDPPIAPFSQDSEEESAFLERFGSTGGGAGTAESPSTDVRGGATANSGPP